jgi:NAD(P)-dependent dehydrogenase (short-subunit alcohol dehydrogenase family)
MPGRLAGKVVLVSGAAGGKGLALGRTLSREGARIIMSDVKEDAVARNAAEFSPDVVRSIPLDVSKEDEWAEAVAFTTETYGRMDVLVNSARKISRDNLETCPIESWKEQFAVNLDGALLGIRHALPALRASGAGSIVNVVSISAVEPFLAGSLPQARQ